MSIVKRNNSKYWYIQFQLNGRTYVQSSKTTDKRLAEQMEVKLRNEVLHQQTFGTKDKIKVAALVTEFLSTKQHLSSFQHYCRYGALITQHFGSEIDFDKLSRRDLDKLRVKLTSSGRKDGTVRHYLNFFNSLLGYAKTAGYRVPEIEVMSLKQTPNRLRYLTPEEEERLLKSLDPTRDIPTLPKYEDRSPQRNQALQNQYDFVVTLLDTGARFSEITHLEWQAIDWDKRTIRLWRPKVRNQSILYMSERLYDVLKRRFYNRNPEVSFVFASRNGTAKPYSSRTARRIFDRVGLHDCSYHTLRHTLATRLIQNGLNLYEVKEILGHTDIKTTMRYAHLEQAETSLKAKQVLDALHR